VDVHPEEYGVVIVAAVMVVGETGHGRLLPMWLPALDRWG
jgi:hypothetical protein